MGWRSDNQRDDDNRAWEKEELRKLPLSQRYNWPAIAIFWLLVAIFVVVLWRSANGL